MLEGPAPALESDEELDGFDLIGEKLRAYHEPIDCNEHFRRRQTIGVQLLVYVFGGQNGIKKLPKGGPR